MKDANDPAFYFGGEVRRERLAVRMSLAALGRVTGYHASQVSRVERAERTASEKFAHGCDKAFPGRGGWFWTSQMSRSLTVPGRGSLPVPGPRCRSATRW